MSESTTTRPTWWEMTVGFVVSLVVNVGYMFIAYSDQRVILMLILTVVVGMGMLFGLRSGAYGMGAILGAAASIAIVLALVGIFDWSWLKS
jgi:hypothetical protein